MNMQRFRIITVIAAIAILATAIPADVSALSPRREKEAASYNALPPISGYTVKEECRFDYIDSDVYVLEHDKTKARVVFVKNDDPNRYFMLGFDTHPEDNKGAAHVLEHSVMDGSVKYPSQNIPAALKARSYTTFMNAFTKEECTLYPVASLSEKQLLASADYYADSCFEPMILQDEDIFRSEAWRLIPGQDGELKMGGTIYSEMLGRYTPDTAAIRKAVGQLYEGCPTSYEPGGTPQDILSLTYDEVKDFHKKYYNAANCTAYLYGDIQDPEAFLRLLDRYFTEFPGEKVLADRKTVSAKNGHTQKKYSLAIAPLSGKEGDCELVYAVTLGELNEEQLERLYAFSKICSLDRYTPKMYLQGTFPEARFGCGLIQDSGNTVFYISASAVKEEKAQDVADAINALLSNMAKDGLEKEETDSFANAMETDVALTREGDNAAVNILMSMANYDSGDRGETFYLRMRRRMADMSWFDRDAIMKTASDILACPGSATVLIVPDDKLLSRQEASLEESLKKIRTSMSDGDLKKLVEDEERIEEKASEDPSEQLKKLSVVKVSDLTDETKDYRFTDEADKNGPRLIGIYSDIKKIQTTKLYLDASDIDQEMLGYLALYVDLVNGGFISAGEYERDDLMYGISDCTSSGQEISLYVASSQEGITPYVTVRFTSSPQMTEKAYDLAYVRLFESRFDDPVSVKEGIRAIRNNVARNITNNPERVACCLAGMKCSPSLAYYEYTHYIDYYDFLGKLEDNIGGDYRNICAKLDGIGEKLCNSRGAVIGYVLTKPEESGYREVANSFLGKLENRENRKFECDPTVYEYPLAIATGSRVVSNALCGPDPSAFGIKDDVSNGIALSVLTEDYLEPNTRDVYGAYTCSWNDAYPAITLYTGSDPTVNETQKVFAGSGNAWKSIRSSITDDELEGYVITAYCQRARSSGNISDALGLIEDIVSGKGAGRRREELRDLKNLKKEDLEKYDSFFDAMSEGTPVTVGSGEMINRNKSVYAQILTPFE